MCWKPGQALGRSNKDSLYPIKSTSKTAFESESNNNFISDVKLLMHAVGCRQEYYQYICPGLINYCKGCKLTSKYREVTTLFSDETEHFEKQLENPLVDLPEIVVQIGTIITKGLIDTGSQITCISDSFYIDLLKDLGKLSEIPIPAIQIQGAVGRKSEKLNKMCLITMKIGGFDISTPCLIVKKLIRPLILGIDFLERVKAQIDCSGERILRIKHLNKLIQIKMGLNNCNQINEIENNLDKNLNTICTPGGALCVNSIKSVTNSINQGGEVEFNQLNQVQQNKQLNNTMELKINDYLAKQDMPFECKEVLLPLLLKHREVFSEKPGRTDKYFHEIKMLDNKPFVKRSYPVPYAHREQVANKIKEYEQLGIIKRESTDYCSPLTCTIKRDGSVRILLDARELNKRMQGDVESPPLTTEILQSFHGVQYMSIIDLNDAYFQIPLKKESTKYTGFTFDGKSYTYNVLPQGLKTSVGSFSRAIDIILGPELKDFCVAYMDDLCVYTRGDDKTDIKQHAEHISRVLDKLNEAGLTCKLEKCNFLKKEVKLLGHIVSTKGIRMDPDKIKAIKQFPTPKNVKQIRSFLGLLNYYRKFVKSYGELIKPLSELLGKRRYIWGKREQDCFEDLKEKFLETIMLEHPLLNRDYYLQTDSSNLGISGCLYQIDDNGDQRVISYCSKGLSSAEKNWSVSEQELWAIIYSIRKFETYLRGVNFTIKTDHKSLLFLQNWKLCSARIIRWVLYLGQFQYKIEHVKGVDNVAVDILSRFLPDTNEVQETKVKCPEIVTFKYTNQKELISMFQNIITLQSQDDVLKEIINSIKITSGSGKDSNKKGYYLDGGILKYKAWEQGRGVLVIPTIMQSSLIKGIHEELGHFGKRKVFIEMKQRFYFSNMRTLIGEYLRTCDICQKSKHEVKNYMGKCKTVSSNDVGDLVFADIYGPLPASKFGYKYICVIQDSFSKYIKLYPLKNATGVSVLRSIKHFHKIILIKNLVTDNGSQFTSRVLENGLKELNIKLSHTTIRNPRPNSVERVNRELGRFFRTYCSNNHKSWSSILGDIEECYNKSNHESTKFSPNKIVFGEDSCLSIDKFLNRERVTCENLEELNKIRENARKHLKEMARKRALIFDKSHHIRTYQLGDWVKLRTLTKSDAKQKITKKINLLFQGPFRVGSIPYDNVYCLICPETGKVIGNFNAIHIARYYTNKAENSN